MSRIDTIQTERSKINLLSLILFTTVILFSMFFTTNTVYATEQGSAVTTSDKESNENYYGPIKSTDDLWQLAKKFRPNDRVTIEKTAVAIYQLNPKAFQYHNLNGLMDGYFLEIPTLDQIKAIKEQNALDIVHQQNQAWAKLNETQVNNAQSQEVIEEVITVTSESSQQLEKDAMSQLKPPGDELEILAEDVQNIVETDAVDNVDSNENNVVDEKIGLIEVTNDQGKSNNSRSGDLTANDGKANSSDELIVVREASPPEYSSLLTSQTQEQDSNDVGNAHGEINTDSSKLMSEISALEQQNLKLNSIIRHQDAIINKVNRGDAGASDGEPISPFGHFLMRAHLNNELVVSIEKYQHWLVILGLAIIVIILMLIRRRLVKRKRHMKSENAPSAITPEMLKEFSGDSIYDTQLDLATAYIALRRYDEAIPLLESVISTGEPEQVTYAQNLMDALEKKRTEE